jgi:hypothetical protein
MLDIRRPQRVWKYLFLYSIGGPQPVSEWYLGVIFVVGSQIDDASYVHGLLAEAVTCCSRKSHVGSSFASYLRERMLPGV